MNSDLSDYAYIAREFLSLHKVFRYHMKKVADMDNDEVIRACHDWYTAQHMEAEYRTFENQQLGIEDSPYVTPRDKFDTPAVDWLMQAPPEQVLPSLPTLMTWLQDLNWPVAQAILPLLAKYGDETLPLAESILQADQTDEIWKYWIIRAYAPLLTSKQQARLKPAVKRIAYQPTEGEVTEEVQEAALEYLAAHD